MRHSYLFNRTILTILALLLIGFVAAGQDQKLKVKVSGTGRTTGHVVMYFIENTGNQIEKGTIGPFLIPGNDTYQGYVIPGTHNYEVASGDSVSLFLDGFCTSIHKPPFPDGAPMTPVSKWVSPESGLPIPAPGVTIPENSGFTLLTADAHPGIEDVPGVPPGQILYLSYPDTSLPFPYSIDIDAYPEEAAPLVFDIVEQISVTFDSLWEAGAISTPIPPSRAKTELTQQSVWLALSILENQPYTREDLNNRVVEQYETNTGQPLTTAPPAVQEELNSGVEQIWNTITFIGLEAKVLTEVDPSETEPPEESSPCNFSHRRSEPKLNLDFKISDAWADAETRAKAQQDLQNMLLGVSAMSEYEYTTGSQPTSAYSLWNHNQLGAYTNAAAWTVFIYSDASTEFVSRTERLDTEAAGDYSVGMDVRGEDCQTFVSGVARVRLTANTSAFDPSAGHETELAVLDFLYSASVKLFMALRANPQSVYELVEELGMNELEGELEEVLDQAGLSPDMMQKEVFKLLQQYARENGYESLDELIEYANNFDISDASSVLRPIVNAVVKSDIKGKMDVTVGSKTDSVKVSSLVEYLRTSIQEGGINGGGSDIDSVWVSDSAPGTLTVELKGAASAKTEARGNGQAYGYLESDVLIVLVGVCILPNGKVEWETLIDNGAFSRDLEHLPDLQRQQEEIFREIDAGMRGIPAGQVNQGNVEGVIRRVISAH